MFLVLLTIGSLAADELFLVNFTPSSMPGFENLNILCSPLFLRSQDSSSVLCIMYFVVGTPTNDLLLRTSSSMFSSLFSSRGPTRSVLLMVFFSLVDLSPKTACFK